MSKHTVTKVTISLPQELLDVADMIARERKVSRSRVIADLIEKEVKDQECALMAEGYRQSALDNRRLANEAYPLASEGIAKSTSWEETNDG